MSSDDHFLAALAFVLEFEGRGQASEHDRGGATDYGISLRFLQGLPDLDGDLNGDGHVTAADIADLSSDVAGELYRTYFWDYYRLNEIYNGAVATRAFSLFVNMRGPQAARILQRACRAVGDPVVEDGILGSKTLAKLNRRAPLALIPAIRSEAAAVYRMIIQRDPAQQVHYRGWLRRAYS